jgi:hypothetical protein
MAARATAAGRGGSTRRPDGEAWLLLLLSMVWLLLLLLVQPNQVKELFLVSPIGIDLVVS